jgi:hypothetical protein
VTVIVASPCGRARAPKGRRSYARGISGADDLTDYQFNSNSCHHLFCKHCGVRAFEWADIPKAGGKYYSVMAPCVDDLVL